MGRGEGRNAYLELDDIHAGVAQLQPHIDGEPHARSERTERYPLPREPVWVGEDPVRRNPEQ